MKLFRSIPRSAVLAALAMALAAAPAAAPRTLSFDDRVAAQRAIEQVFWNHRIWPAANPGPKPPLDEVLSGADIAAKVNAYLGRPRPAPQELQAELDRMARDTREPQVLRELFGALGNDPFVIAETLARQTLASRADGAAPSAAVSSTAPGSFTLPAAPLADCVNDTWSRTRLETPDGRTSARAVWTGAEMLVWGGSDGTGNDVGTGGRYNPATDTWTNISTGTNAPSPRSDHTAVWTGTEMIVWGGAYKNTGGRYNPVTDSWTATSTGAGVPEGRGGHTAVWTGTEMIVWGGISSPFLNSGGRYNPSTNSWTPTSTGANVPLARYLHTAVWTGTEMIVWGGQANGATQNTGARYTPGTDSWVPTSSATAPEARYRHAAVWTGGVMIVYGGTNTLGNSINSGGRYNPSSDNWSPTSTGTNVPSVRSGFTAVWTGTEMIVWGGLTGTGQVNTGGRYNPATNTWAATSTGANVASIRQGHVAVWTGSEMIVWTGSDITGNLRTGARYDPSGDSWTPMVAPGYALSPRFGPTAVWTGAEVVVWGGQYPSPTTPYNTGARYVPATDTWTPTSVGAGVPTARGYHTAVWTGTEMIVWGGQGPTFGYLNTGGRYNPATDTWLATSTGANVAPARQSHAAVWTGTRMIVWGGYGNAGRLNTGGQYDPVANTWSATSTGTNVPAGRGDLSAVWSGTEMIVWGGNDNSGQVVNTGGRYNPATDTWLPTSTGTNCPAARYGPPAVWTGTEMVVWGGANTSVSLNTGGRYNPSTNSWSATSTGAGVPTARSSHTAVWTGTAMIVWGGYDATGFTNTGARYNPVANTWTATSMVGDVAPPRTSHAAAWTGHEMIVWGGWPMSSTGGRYCACPSGQIVYRDADGDGYGDPAVTSSSCDGTVPSGWSAVAGDCNDAESTAHPGGAEICDGLDNDCDGTVDNGGAALCSDGTACTSDACNGALGCAHAPLACLDGNPCTDDACDPALGCVFSNNTAACDDGDACTTGDGCGGGACAGAPLNCDDGNACTADSCNPASGCVHTNLTDACDDGDLCTTGDACSAGTCAGTPVVCNDGNVCTADACNPATGLCDFVGGDCVLGVDPANDTVDASVGTNVTVTFNEPVDPASVTAATFRLVGPGEVAVPAALAVTTSGTRLTLDPADALAPDTTYRVETTSGILGPGPAPAQPFTSFLRTGAAPAATEIPTVSEPSAPTPTQSHAGAAVSRAGDLNQDGIADQLTGAPGYTVGGAFAPRTSSEAGAVLVYFGSPDPAERAQADIIFEGVDPHDRVGVSVAGDFDFNGDGLPDIVIGAEQVDRATDPDHPTPTGNGKVYVIFFDPSDTVHYPNIADPAVPDTVSLALVGQPGGVPGVVFAGAAFGDQAGFSVDGGGTSTTGGGTDILIGAPGADPDGRTDAGTSYVVFDDASATGAVSLTRISSGLPDEVPGKAYFGAVAGDNLGFSVAFGGPVVEGSDPLRGSLILGAPGADGGKGKVIVPGGDPDTTPIIVDAIGVGQPGLQLGGTQPGEKLGTSVADGGDALVDGAPDVLAGAPEYDVGGDVDAGRVIQTTGTLASGVYDADEVGTTVGGVTWTGSTAGDELGFAVAGVGDVTGDGYDDVVLGAPFFDPVVDGVPQPDAGAVYVIAGAPAADTGGTQSVTDVGSSIAGEVLTGTQAGEAAGSSIASSGDVTGDGDPDFAVGAPGSNADAGTVYTVTSAAPAAVGACGPAGCQVADLLTGAEADLPAGALAAPATLDAAGILAASELPAPVPAGKMLLGAARFTPDGLAVDPPFATIYIPTNGAASEPGRLRAPNEVLPLFRFDGSGWSAAGVDGATGANPSYPGRTAVTAVVDTLATYAVFLNDADGDAVRDETDNCPTVANPAQTDTDADGIGDACECLGVVCDDANPCTDDGCVPATGACAHANNVVPCDDGDPCTAGDACGGGTCLPGAPITAPPEVTVLEASADKTTITWAAASYAASYDVLRGSTGALPAGPGGGDEICFGGIAGTAASDATVPAAGDAFWYLARGTNACGTGSYGAASDGTPRTSSTCP